MRGRFPTPVVLLFQALASAVVVVAAGAISGVLWERWWDPPVGQVQAGVWGVFSETGLRAQFGAVGLYVSIAIVAGLVTGLLCALLFDRSELLTLAVVLGSSFLGGWVMWRIGVSLGPPDPQRLAPGLADGTELPGRLMLGSRTPFVAFPIGGLVGFTLLLLSVSKSGRRTDTTGHDDGAHPMTPPRGEAEHAGHQATAYAAPPPSPPDGAAGPSGHPPAPGADPGGRSGFPSRPGG